MDARFATGPEAGLAGGGDGDDGRALGTLRRRALPAFVALNSSLSLDWRLWPEDIEGRSRTRVRLPRGLLSAAELKAIEDGLARVGREIGPAPSCLRTPMRTSTWP